MRALLEGNATREQTPGRFVPRVTAHGGRSERCSASPAALVGQEVVADHHHPIRSEAFPDPSGWSRCGLFQSAGRSCDRRAPAANLPVRQRFRRLWCALRCTQFEGAFVETILRNPQLTFVSQNYVTLRGVTELACSRDLRLVDMHGRGLSRIGTTNAVSTGPYAPCWAWSDYLYFHRARPDGIAYASRHNPLQICYAIFERSGLSFAPGRPVPFADMLPEIRRILRRYSKIMTRP